jgi:SLT domain-containing protein/phage-related protein
MSTRTLTYILLGKDQLTPAFKKAGKEGEESASGIAGSFSKIGLAGVAVAGVVGGLMVKAIKDARAEGWSPLKVAAQDAGIAFAQFKPKAEAAGEVMAKLGFSQADVNASLKVLVTSTRNGQLSLNSLGTAADFARFKGIGLSDAAKLLAKAATGSTRALKDVGISTADLPKHFATTGTAASRMRIIMELLSKRVGGQAAAASQTFGGKLAAMHAQIENVSAKIGSALLPILSALLTMISTYVLPVIQKFGEWFTNVGAPAIKKFSDQVTPFVQVVLKQLFEYISYVANAFKTMPEPARTALLAVLGFVVAAAALYKVVEAFKAMKAAVKAFDVASKFAAATNPWVLLALAIVVVAVLVVTHWNTVKKVTLEVWGTVQNFVVGVWHTIYNTTIAIVNAIVNTVMAGFHWVQHIVSVTLNWIRDNWPLLLGILTGPIGMATYLIIRNWQNIKDACANAFNAVVSFFKGLPGRILGAIGYVGNLLTGIGGQIISGLYHGITGALSAVGNWVKSNIFDPIVGAIKGLFGIHSPSSVMMAIGGHLVGGLILGLLKQDPTKFISKVFGGLPQALGALLEKGLINIAKLPGKALKALGSLGSKIGGFFAHLFGGGKAGGGVLQWKNLVDIALMLNNLPSSLDARVLYQMQTESGGNPNAINLTDSNAAAGDPSRGLLQTIGSTFAAYHIPGTSNNIYDPLANIAAAINYAKHVYGPSLMRGSMGMGSGHGYAAGTNRASRGWAWVGERGRELVNFRGGEQVIPNNRLGHTTQVVWTGNVIVQGHALASKQELGRTVQEAIAYSQRHGNK